MSNFQWQTDDESDWGDLDQPAPQARKRPALRNFSPHIWLPLLLAVVVVVVAGTVLRGRLSATVEREVTAAEAEVVASYELVVQKAQAQDIELFATLLSGRDPDWWLTQQQLAANDGLLDRSMLRWQTNEQAPEIAQVELSPDMLSAEITATVQYSVPNGAPITVYHTAIFRQGENHYLFAPPEDDYWGTTIRTVAGAINITHPERDAALVERLSADLNSLYMRLCRNDPGIYCSSELAFPIIFSENPSSLANLQVQPAPLPTSIIVLPTPTLVGLPTDDASYTALLHAYADQIFSVTVADLVGYKCCKQALFFRATLDQQLQQIGVRSGAISAETVTNLLERGVALNHHPSIGWHINDLDTAIQLQHDFATTFVDFFLTSNPYLSASTLQRALVNNGDAFDNWIQSVAESQPESITGGASWVDERRSVMIGRAYSRYLNGLLDRTYTPPPPPQPVPNASAVLACQDNDMRSRIAAYNLQTGVWDELYSGAIGRLPAEVELRVIDLPNHDGVWIQPIDRRYSVADWDSDPRIWRNGELIKVEVLGLYYWMWEADVDNALTIFQIEPIRADGSAEWSHYMELPLETCSAESCQLNNLLGSPYLSPNGTHTLYLNTIDAGIVTIVDQNGNTVETNENFFASTLDWLDDSSYIWVDAPDGVIMRKQLGEDATVWLTVDDVANAIAPFSQTFGVEEPALTHFVFDPSNRNQLVVFVGTPDPVQQTIAVYYDIVTGEATLHQPIPNATLYSLADNGVFSTFTAQSNYTGSWSRHEMIIHNADTLENDHYAFGPSDRFTWVDEVEHWGLILNNDVVRLVAPEHDYTQFIIPPYQNCNSIAWMHNEAP